MNALIPDLQHLPKNEINNIKALCNYNADNILQNTSKISAEEFRDQLFTNISNNAKKGNISKDGRNMVINNFTKNKYFTPTDTAPRTQPSADNLLNKALEGSNFNIKDLDGMIDASNRNEKNENINKLLNNPELSSADRAEDINKNLLDVLVKHRQKKLSADYLNINAEDYQEHQLLVANYIAQMNALIPELQHLHKYEQNNIRAVFNYNADDILRNTSKISAEEFRDQLFTNITNNAKKENINNESLNIVIKNFTLNKYFTPTKKPAETTPEVQTSEDDSPSSNPELVTNTKPTITFATDNNPPKAEATDIDLETQPSEDLEEPSTNDLLNKTLENSNFNIEDLNGMIDDIDNNTDNVNIHNVLNEPKLSSADRAEEINQNLRDALVTYRQKKLSEADLNINADDYDAKNRIIFANYVAQMGDLTPKLQRLRKDELDNIQAICNYNANNILKDKENNLSNEEFKKQLISSITKDAKRGNIDEQNINIIIDAFNQNKYFDISFKPPSKP
jgi:K+-transporting ATPase c subunit